MKRTDFSDRFPGALVSIPEGDIAYIPDPLPPRGIDITNEVLHTNEAALLAIGELRAIIPSLPSPRLITSPFLRREAMLSSRIEGTYTRLGKLYLLEAEVAENINLEGAKSEEQADTRDVFNYVKALESGLAQIKKLPVCMRLIKNLHGILLSDVRGKHQRPGEIRDRQNFIGQSDKIADARFVPPPCHVLPQVCSDMERYINRGSGELPTLVQAALIHYQFETIHPFLDGNGRLGRLLISLFLAERKILPEPLLYLSAYFDRLKKDYVQKMWAVSRSGAWMDWVAFFLEGIKVESTDAAERARKLIDLREKLRSKFQVAQGSAALLKLTDFLFQSPVISVPMAAKLLGMTYKGAQKNVEKLQDHEFLTECTGRKKNRLFLATPIVDLLELGATSNAS